MPLGAPPTISGEPVLRLEPTSWSSLEGWAEDDHAAALRAFLCSCGPVLEAAAKGSGAGRTTPPEALLAVCRRVLATAGQSSIDGTAARQLFETEFVPHAVHHDGPAGLLTAYYEPVLDGSREKTGRFRIPVFRRPPDLVNMMEESERASAGQRLTHMRQTNCGLLPYPTRADIEQGMLAWQGLELLWLEDEVDTFFMHIQGSGRIRFPDGSLVRITYDGKNGHPYTSVGRYLIDAGLFPANEMSLDALKAWLKADPVRGRDAMWQNKSFVFFRELSGAEDGAPLGVLHIPLSDGRSLAVDTAYHAIGTPIFVTAPDLRHAGGGRTGFRRLMIAQDVGSAIRGPERGDLYFGSGPDAGALAGITKHGGSFTVLVAQERS